MAVDARLIIKGTVIKVKWLLNDCLDYNNLT